RRLSDLSGDGGVEGIGSEAHEIVARQARLLARFGDRRARGRVVESVRIQRDAGDARRLDVRAQPFVGADERAITRQRDVVAVDLRARDEMYEHERVGRAAVEQRERYRRVTG